MKSPERSKWDAWVTWAVWIVWTVVYAPALGVCAIAVYRHQGGASPPVVGFDADNPTKARGPGRLRLWLVCDRPLPGLKVAVVAAGGSGAARPGGARGAGGPSATRSESSSAG